MKLNDFTNALESKYINTSTTSSRILNESYEDNWYDEGEKYSLVGQDGNAFALMGYTARCMKECGLRNEISEMREKAMSGDYNNLICVCDEYVQRCNEIAGDMDESLKESCKLTESAKRVAQISFDIMYDPESDEPNSQPEDIAYGFEWELSNTGYCKVLGSNIEDITDVYKGQYSNDFPELNESLTEGAVTDRVKRFIDTVEKFQDDMTFTDNKNDHKLELTNKEIEMLDSLRSSLSRYSKLKESLNESSMPPIRKVLQDNKIMDTLDKDPQGTINKALQVVRDSDEISAKDKNTFANAVGKGPLNKKVSSLASYFYDVNRVGRKR